MKKLRDLLSIDNDTEVIGIADDSRLVKKGYIFVATRGYHVDHYDYILDAIQKGCCFVVCNREIEYDFPHLVVNNIYEFYIELCKKYYDISLDDFYFIGITGTDGKTTTASIVSKLIDNCAYIGTNGLMIYDKIYSLSNTTPCVFELYDCFRKIKDAGINVIVMEVSSEALLHHRLDGIVFDIIAFTNITGDHLNIHKSFENYVNTKMTLLNYIKDDSKVIVNNDDVNLQKIKCQNLFTYGKNMSSNYIISNIQSNNIRTVFNVSNGLNTYQIACSLYGEYNVYNVLEAYIISLLFGVDDKVLLRRINSISCISGRGERLDFGQDYIIVLDYAHTINGVKSILDAYQDYDDIITVTGAAGGREKEKRPIIGKMVIEMSDTAIFTMDDPRGEDVNQIIDELVGDGKNYIRIIDREKAINYALSIAKKNSVVLIIGKGRDNYMAIGDKKISYSDYDVVKRYFNN